MSTRVWEQSYPPGVRWDAPLPEPVAIESLLETAAQRWPQRIALDLLCRPEKERIVDVERLVEKREQAAERQQRQHGNRSERRCAGAQLLPRCNGGGVRYEALAGFHRLGLEHR